MNLQFTIIQHRLDHLRPLVNLSKICVHKQLFSFIVKLLIKM